MSFRAILIGLLLALLVAVGGHFNDVYMQQTYMVGNFFPISVIGILILLVLVINPILFRIRPTWKLRFGELALIVALPLTACVVPGSGFLRTFTPVMALPHHYEQMDTSWQKNEVMSYVPEGLLAGHEEVSEDDFLGSFLQGKGGVNHHIGLRDIPLESLDAVPSPMGPALLYHDDRTDGPEPGSPPAVDHPRALGLPRG